MKRYIYLFLAYLPLIVLGMLSASLTQVHADIVSSTGLTSSCGPSGSSCTVDSANCNSSAPDGTSSNGADGGTTS